MGIIKDGKFLRMPGEMKWAVPEVYSFPCIEKRALIQLQRVEKIKR